MDCHLSQLAEKIRSGQFGHVDYAIIEVTRIGENGELYPVLNAAVDDTIVACADKILVEVNTSVPDCINDLCDFVGDVRCGISELHFTPYIPCDSSKIAGVVMTDAVDSKIYYRDTNKLTTPSPQTSPSSKKK